MFFDSSNPRTAGARSSKAGAPSQTFLFLTTSTAPKTLREFKKLHRATASLGESTLLLHSESGEPPASLRALPHQTFTWKELTRLGYPTIGDTIVPGHVHFAILWFFHQHPDFDYYWFIEDDIRFSGEWGHFFNAFREIPDDYLTSHIYGHDEAPKWAWWNLDHPRLEIPVSERLATFNPVCRLSRKALAYLHEMLLDGWRGHSEVILPTLLRQGGLSLSEIGGKSRFTLPGFENRFYPAPPADPERRLLEGTHRFRPPFFRAGRKPDTLYHPIKPAWEVIRWRYRFWKDGTFDR